MTINIYQICRANFVFVLLFSVVLNHISIAQTGYIYLHKKALDEGSSPSFTFNVSGGPTNVPAITLSDQANTFTTIRGLGGDAVGGLWALSANSADGAGNYATYYRASGSGSWVLKTGSGIDIDGGAAGTSVSATSTGQVFYDDGTTRVNVTGNLPAAAVDVSDNWQGIQYAVLSNDQIWKRVIPSTTWTQIPGITGKNVDAVPNTNQIVYVASNQANIIRINNDGSGSANLGSVENPTFEVAVSGDGSIYARNNDNLYKYSTGTTWVKEVKTQQLLNITGGPATQLWGNITRTGSATSNRIYSRAETGDYISDENVRLSPNDNASLIAVSAGTYTITENEQLGWGLNSITLFESQTTSSVDVSSRTATLEVSEGEVVHVVFENQLVQTTLIGNDCNVAATFKETFGAGTGFGAPLTGLTSYHHATSDFGYGFYGLIRNSNMMNAYVGNYTDHTGNTNGRMLAVDGTIERGVFYRRRFTGLIPGAKYSFSAWIMNLNSGASAAKPNVSFNVYSPTDGHLISFANTGNVISAGVWQQATLVFTATETSLDLELMNNTLGTQGNDLAIDDISFGVAIPQPVTTQVDANCTTGGSITVTSPLSPGYEYSIDGVTYQQSPSFGNLPPGNYSVTARYVEGTCVSPPTLVSIAAATGCPPTANDNSSVNNPVGSGVTINILANDMIAGGGPATPANTTVEFTTSGLPAGSTISGNEIIVPGEGVYTYDPATGNLTFSPEQGFVGDPSPLSYVLKETATGLTDTAVITITYNPMPVELVFFKATRLEKTVSLEWATTWEVNSERFEIERSQDAKKWLTIGVLDAGGESKDLLKYSFLDATPFTGLSYYRLKMIDNDQTYTYSQIQSLRVEIGSDGLVVYPNPSTELLFLKNTPITHVKSLVLLSKDGVVLRRYSRIPVEGIRLNNVPSGSYLVDVLLQDGSRKIQRIVIER